jgi:small nuclear ribonucleoprotein (snRNP)-like protein
MNTRCLTVSLFVLTLLTQPMFLFGQSLDKSDWSGVKALPSGTNIRVETKAGKKFDGKLESVNDTMISLSSNAKTESFSVVDVKKIYRFGKGSRGKSTAIGAALGAGVGAGIGLAALGATGGSDDINSVLAPFIAIGGGMGAALGAAFPGKKRILLFEAK